MDRGIPGEGKKRYLCTGGSYHPLERYDSLLEKAAAGFWEDVKSQMCTTAYRSRKKKKKSVLWKGHRGCFFKEQAGKKELQSRVASNDGGDESGEKPHKRG